MSQVIYMPQYRNPWEQMLPQFVSNMILQHSAQKFRERMLETERGQKLEEAGYTTEAPEPVTNEVPGVPGETETVAPKPAITIGGRKYYTPTPKFSDIPNMPGYKLAQMGNKFEIVKPEKELTPEQTLAGKGIYKLGDYLFKQTPQGLMNIGSVKQDTEKNPQYHFVTDDKGDVTQVTNFPDGRIAKTPLGRMGKTKEGTETSWQAKTDYFVKNGKVYAQNYDFNPKTRTRQPVGEPYEAPRSVTEDIFDKLKKLTGEGGETPAYQGPGIYRNAQGGEVKINSEAEWKTLIGAK